MAAEPEASSAAATTGDRGLVRAMGTLALAAGIVNVTIGGGIFRLPAGAAESLGAAAPLAYVVCAVAMGLIVLCFAEAGSRVSLTGGLYAYVEVAFGGFVGFLSGFMLWAGITAALAAVSSFFADSIVALVPALAGVRAIVIVVVLAALAWLNVRGVRGAARFNAVMTAAKLIPLLLFVLIGAFAVHAVNYHVAAAPTQSSLARASTLLIFAFLGVESALVPSGEVRDPSRTVPRAIFLALAAIAVVYLAVHLVAQGILGPALAGDKTPLATAAAAAMGPVGGTLVLVGSVLSMFGYVSGMTLAVPRMLFAFGRDGFLPRGVAAVHPRFHTPWVAIVVQAVIVAAVAVSGSFETLAIIANGSVLLVYGACCLAALELRRRDVRAEGATPFRVPVPGVAPVLGALVVAWLLSTLTGGEWKALGVVALVAIVIYGGARVAGRGAREVANAA